MSIETKQLHALSKIYKEAVYGGAGGATGSLDASNMFKPALSRGEIQCIGATTLDEYRQHIEKDGALERRFQKIIVEETTQEKIMQLKYQ